jgi:hypothetical protein
MESFVRKFEAEIEQVWESMVRDYRDKTGTPEIDLQVEGHFRMKLIYRLLSEDLIEERGAFPPPGIAGGSGDALLAELGRRIEEATGDDGVLIGKTLRSLHASGYLKTENTGGTVRWYWTHNRHVDHELSASQPAVHRCCPRSNHHRSGAVGLPDPPAEA